MPMTTWCADPEEARPVLEALAEGYAIDNRPDLPEPGESAAGGGARDILLLYLTPAQALCRTMLSEASTATALRMWMAQTEAILNLSRRNRRQVKVLDIAAALEHPVAFRGRFDLPDGAGPMTLRRNDQDDMFLMMLAQRLLMSDPRCRMLMAELEAASIALIDGPAKDPVDPDAVFLAYLEMRGAQEDAEAQKAMNRAMQEELKALTADKVQLEHRALSAEKSCSEALDANRLLEAQSRAMQTELDLLNADILRFKQENTRIETQHDQSRNTNKLLQEQLEQLREVNDRLLQEQVAQRRKADDRIQATNDKLREAEATLHTLEENLAARTTERDETQARFAQLEAELNHVYASKSFRITAPLRRIRAFFTRQDPV